MRRQDVEKMYEHTHAQASGSKIATPAANSNLKIEDQKTNSKTPPG